MMVVFAWQHYNSLMSRLQQLIEQIDQQSQPPVHLWKPDYVGEIDIKIDLNGNWFHEGEPIVRDKLVRLFASILWFEDGQHYLVTPVEKLAITVADSPYLIHQMERAEDAWFATTNTHEQVLIGADHSVELRRFQEQWVPYVNIRYDLWARVNRSIYFQWVAEALDLAEAPNQAEALDKAEALQEAKAPNQAITLNSGDYIFEVARA